MTKALRSLADGTLKVDMTPWLKPPCPCGHDVDDLCLNGLIYVNCGLPECGGACEEGGHCESLPGCCDPDLREVSSQ